MDEREADTPGSKTASSCTTTGNEPGERRTKSSWGPCHASKGVPEYSVQCKKRVLEGDVASDGGRCAAMASDEAANPR